MINDVLAFDVETIPDVALGRRQFNMGEEIPDADVVRAMEQVRMQKTGGHQFQPLHAQRVICISVVYRGFKHSGVLVKSLGNLESSEVELLSSFYEGIERANAPQLVSWNGNGFDLPVLNYRAMLYGINAMQFWETGANDKDFRFNNYISRYHERHLDLMDVLSRYNIRAVIGLDECATAMGFPGKYGLSGAEVWPAYQEGRLKEIRQYCEVDALMTYLVLLRFEFMRGNLMQSEYVQLCDELENYLEEEGHEEGCEHFHDFLKRWDRSIDPVNAQGDQLVAENLDEE